MTLHTLDGLGESDEPSEERVGESPISYALRAIGKFLAGSSLAREQFKEARHDRADADRAAAQARRIGEEFGDIEARAIAERHKAGPHKRVNRRFGAGLAVALALLDALPSYWSAQAFGLDNRSTLVLTVLLCAALGGAMWLLDLFASKGRRLSLRVVEGALSAGFVALVVLRLDYLQATTGEGFWPAATQALALTALSAALVAVGFVLLSHRVPKAVASADGMLRQAERSRAKEVAAAGETKAVMSRAALEDTIVSWALAHEPAAMGHDQFLQAIGDALDILLTR